MGTQYLLDSNTIIYLSKGILTAENSSVIAVLGEDPSNISVITQIEVLGWNPPTLQEAEKLQRLVDNATVYPLTDEIVQKTIQIKKSHRLKLPDAVIAATALVHHFTLVTRNTGDFLNLPGLELVNPFEG